MRKFGEKYTCCLLIFALCIGMFAPYTAVVSSAESNKTIAKALTDKTYKSEIKYTKSSCFIPDFGAFTNYEFKLEHRKNPEEVKYSKMYEYWEVSDEVADSYITAYLNLLKDSRFQLKFTSEEHDSSTDSYYFTYTGSADVTDSTIEVTYKPRKDKLYIYYSKEFNVIDSLDRYGGTTIKNPTIQGTSAREAVVKTSKGIYQTSDKRLSVKAGYADVIVNGKHYAPEVSFTSSFTNKDGYTRDIITLESVWGDNDIILDFDYNTAQTGSLYDMRDAMIYGSKSDIVFEVGNTSARKGISPEYGGSFEYLTIRVPKWNINGVTVVYFAAKYTDVSNNVNTIEGLIAAKYKDPLAESLETITISKGSTRDITYSNTVVFPNYQTYDWTIVSGKKKISLDKKTSKTCKITAKKTGTAVIRVTYEYGVDEPDVLTGIERNVHRAKHKLYQIQVVD